MTAFDPFRPLGWPHSGEIRMAEVTTCFQIAVMMVADAKTDLAEANKLYSVCFCGRGWIVPETQFLEAATDDEAYSIAGSMKPWMTRELWDRHRLVRVLPPTIGDARSH